MHEDLLSLFETFDACVEEEVSKEEKLKLYTMVVQEIAGEYKELFTTKYCSTNIIYFREFNDTPVRIVSCDAKKWKMKPDYIYSKKEPLGNITYSYLPNPKESDPLLYPAMTVLSGMLAEHFLQTGDFDQAYRYQQDYKEYIRELWETQD